MYSRLRVSKITVLVQQRYSLVKYTYVYVCVCVYIYIVVENTMFPSSRAWWHWLDLYKDIRNFTRHGFCSVSTNVNPVWTRQCWSTLNTVLISWVPWKCLGDFAVRRRFAALHTICLSLEYLEFEQFNPVLHFWGNNSDAKFLSVAYTSLIFWFSWPVLICSPWVVHCSPNNLSTDSLCSL